MDGAAGGGDVGGGAVGVVDDTEDNEEHPKAMAAIKTDTLIDVRTPMRIPATVLSMAASS